MPEIPMPLPTDKIIIETHCPICGEKMLIVSGSQSLEGGRLLVDIAVRCLRCNPPKLPHGRRPGPSEVKAC